MILKLLLSGDGGQGVQLMSKVLCQVIFDKGWNVTSIPNFGLEQRGGTGLMFIQVSDNNIGYPKFSKPDILVVLSQGAHQRTQQYRHVACMVLEETTSKQTLVDNHLPAQSLNIFFLGHLAALLEQRGIVKKEDLYTLLEQHLGQKPMWEENKKAFELGVDFSINL